MVNEDKNVMKMQNIILENRSLLSVSGVLDVLNFDEQMITLDTDLRNTSCERIRFKTK